MGNQSICVENRNDPSLVARCSNESVYEGRRREIAQPRTSDGDSDTRHWFCRENDSMGAETIQTRLLA